MKNLIELIYDKFFENGLLTEQKELYRKIDDQYIDYADNTINLKVNGKWYYITINELGNK